MDPGSSLLCSQAAVYSLYPKSDEPNPLPLQPYVTNQTELDKMRYNVRFWKK